MAYVMQETFKAFISYKHVTQSGFAQKFELDLMHYAWPLFRRPWRIFRDENYIKPGEQIPDTIRSALKGSDFLILLASPESACSEWVEDEIKIWCNDLGRADNLIIVLTSGHIETSEHDKAIDWGNTDALPLILSNHIKSLPLWVDARDVTAPSLQDLRNPAYKLCVNKVSAGLRGIAPNEMTGEEIRTFRKRLLALYTGIALLLTLSGGLFISVLIARENAQQAIEQTTIATTEAERANSNAKRADEEARRAAEEAARADEQRDVAEREAKRAESEAERAFQTLALGATELTNLSGRIIDILRSSTAPISLQIQILREFEATYKDFGDRAELGELRRTTIAGAYERLAAYYYSAGERELSMNAISEVVKINRQLVNEEPKNPCWKTALAASLIRLANERAALGDVNGQVADHSESFRIFHSIAESTHYDEYSSGSCPNGRRVRMLSAVNQAIAALQLFIAQVKNGRAIDTSILDLSLHTLRSGITEFPNDKHMQENGPKFLEQLEQFR